MIAALLLRTDKGDGSREYLRGGQIGEAHDRIARHLGVSPFTVVERLDAGKIVETSFGQYELVRTWRTERLIQECLDQDMVDIREDLPYMEQDGTIDDEESLRAWCWAALGYESE